MCRRCQNKSVSIDNRISKFDFISRTYFIAVAVLKTTKHSTVNKSLEPYLINIKLAGYLCFAGYQPRPVNTTPHSNHHS